MGQQCHLVDSLKNCILQKKYLLLDSCELGQIHRWWLLDIVALKNFMLIGHQRWGLWENISFSNV